MGQGAFQLERLPGGCMPRPPPIRVGNVEGGRAPSASSSCDPGGGGCNLSCTASAPHAGRAMRSLPRIPLLPRLARFVVLGAACGILAACEDEPTGPSAPSPLAAIQVSPAGDTLEVGDTARFTVTAVDSAGAPLPDIAVVWSTGDLRIATVDSTGLVTARAEGTVEVRAEARGARGVASLVVGGPSVVVTPLHATLVDVGETLRFAAEVRTFGGEPDLDAGVAWRSSDPAVATVDAMGTATAVGEGRTTITAESGEASASAILVVGRAVGLRGGDAPARGDAKRLRLLRRLTTGGRSAPHTAGSPVASPRARSSRALPCRGLAPAGGSGWSGPPAPAGPLRPQRLGRAGAAGLDVRHRGAPPGGIGGVPRPAFTINEPGARSSARLPSKGL